MGRGIRRAGSAALDLAYIAAGYLQAYWEQDLQPYDIAAGSLLLEEVGCLCTNQNNEAYDIFNDRMMVAALPGVHPRLLEIVHKHYGDLS